MSTLVALTTCSTRVSGTSGTVPRGGFGAATRTRSWSPRLPAGHRARRCVALERAAQHARDTDSAAASRIEWRQVDLLARPPEPGCFDLVSAQFLQLPPEPRTHLFTALAAAVRDGGMLLVVGHHPSDLATGVPRPPMPELFYTPDEIAGLLDGSWTINAFEARPRPASTPDGADVTVHDTVLVATRPAAASPPP